MAETHPEKRPIGYAGVSTSGQTLDTYIAAMRRRWDTVDDLP